MSGVFVLLELDTEEEARELRESLSMITATPLVIAQNEGPNRDVMARVWRVDQNMVRRERTDTHKIVRLVGTIPRRQR